MAWLVFSKTGLSTLAELMSDVSAGIRLRAAAERKFLLGDQVLEVEHIGLTQTTFRGGQDQPLRNEALLALRDSSAG